MAMGRNLRVYHNVLSAAQGGGGAPSAPRPYSLVLEQRGKGEILLVENYAIVALGEKL